MEQQSLDYCKLFSRWFTEYFKPTVENYCSKKKNSFIILLLIGNTSSHSRALIEMYSKIYVVFMLANTRSVMQSMDQGIMSTSMYYYLRNIFSKTTAVIDNDSSDGSGKIN